MAVGTYFVRSCPTCGRNLEIKVELLNRPVECTHCTAVFVATENDSRAFSDWRIEQALARTQQFLASVGNNATIGKFG